MALEPARGRHLERTGQSFREAVITAYDGRCALSGLPEPLLLDAAHIIADGEELGQPVVPNGFYSPKFIMRRSMRT
jgi:hypothetical protein